MSFVNRNTGGIVVVARHVRLYNITISAAKLCTAWKDMIYVIKGLRIAHIILERDFSTINRWFVGSISIHRN